MRSFRAGTSERSRRPVALAAGARTVTGTFMNIRTCAVRTQPNNTQQTLRRKESAMSGDQTRATRGNRYTDDDLEEARRQVDRAFAILGLVEGKSAQCPECGTSKRGKVALRNDKGYWKCHKCDAWGSSIKLLEAHGYSFVDAVAALLGRPVSNQVTIPKKIVLPEADKSFRSTVDPELYQAIVSRGTFTGAARYYAAWHITPTAVRATGAVRIDDVTTLKSDLTKEFGRGRLVTAGVIKPAEETTNGVDVWLISDKYPVIEPHKLPDGQIVGMQFRPSETQLARISAHKQGDGAYVPKFLSLRGAGPDGLVGCGLDLLDGDDQIVYLVEGFKDLLAVMTMGGKAYALPGAAANLPPVALDVLRRHRLIVALDADDAGEAGSKRLVSLLREAGISQVTVKQDMPAGMDACDVLVARYARNGCSCAACTAEKPAGDTPAG